MSCYSVSLVDAFIICDDGDDDGGQEESGLFCINAAVKSGWNASYSLDGPHSCHVCYIQEGDLGQDFRVINALREHSFPGLCALN